MKIMNHFIIYNISEFFRLNLIALRINNNYKLNIYLLFFLFICIISSILIRTNIINEELLLTYLHYSIVNIIITLLAILAFIYSLKLIFDIINKCIQAYKIIPNFINLYKSNMLNIKSIITLYYIQNIFFILLSLWILYNIVIKLNLFIEDIYIYVISLGILSSLIFIYYYPLKGFNLNTNIKNYPIWVYLILLIIILFYMLIFPLIIFKFIDSDKFIEFKHDLIKKSYNFMDDNTSDSSTVRDSSESNRSINRIESSNNRIIVPENTSSENIIVTSNNTIETVPRHVTNNFNISDLRISNNINPTPRSTLNNPGLGITTLSNPSLTSSILNEIDNNNNVPLQRSRPNIYDYEQPPHRGTSRSLRPTVISIRQQLSNISLPVIKDSNIIPVESTHSLTNKILTEVERVQNINNSKTNLLNENNIKFNVNRLKKFKSVIDLKDKLAKFFNLNKPVKPILIDFSFNNSNILIISDNIYNNILSSSKALEQHMLENTWLISDDEIVIRLNNIIKDINLFKHIQLNINEILNNKHNYQGSLMLINSYIDNYSLNYNFSNDEIYNIKFNKKILEEFKAIFGLKLEFKEFIDIKTFNELKLKEFYALNDLDYLNSINKKFININVLDNFIVFKKYYEFNKNIQSNEPIIINSLEFDRLDSLYNSIIIDFNCLFDNYHPSTIENLNVKYNNYTNIKNINDLKSTRIIEYYANLFKNK